MNGSSTTRTVLECNLCHRKMRLPVMDKKILATCPHCGDRVEVLDGKLTESASVAQQYVFMLQLPFDFLDEFDKMVNVEDRLLAIKPKGWDLDLHKSGSNGYTWPVFTKNPQASFHELKAAFTPEELKHLTALYCPMEPLEPDNLNFLWPNEGPHEFDHFSEFDMIR